MNGSATWVWLTSSRIMRRIAGILGKELIWRPRFTDIRAIVDHGRRDVPGRAAVVHKAGSSVKGPA
jgi:hypothetical protein